jgi:putative peptidoglycan lipid II flippase
MKLLKSTALVSAFTFASRLFGFVREALVARIFGVSLATDAFNVAFRIPNLLRQLFNEGSFATAFVPVLSDYKANRTEAEMRDFINHVCGTLGAVLLLVAGLGVLCAPLIVRVVAPGWHDPARAALTTDLLRVTFPYIFFVSLCGFAGGIMNTHRRFAVPALTPILLNLGMIFGMVVLAKYFAVPIFGLAWGVILGGAVQLAIQVPALMRLGYLPRPRWGWQHSGVRRVLTLMVPSIFGASVAQVNMLVDVAIATFLMTGSVSWLSNADRLLQFPQGVFGVALSAVILPHLSGRFASKDAKGFCESLDWALRMALIIAIPATLTLIWLAQPIIWTVYGYGKYTDRDVHMAAWSLATLALGLPAFISVKVLAPGFFSRQDTKTPVKAAMASLISNMFLNALFVGSALYFTFYAPHAGLSLASATSGYLNAGLLFYWLRRDKIFIPQPGWQRFGVQLLAASLALCAVFYAASSHYQSWIGPLAGIPGHLRLLTVGATVAVGGVAYLGTLWALGLNPKQLLDRHSFEETPK